jgi:hypothetical protein
MSLENALKIFRSWAPESGRWSAWAKPVLFTYAVGAEAPSDGPPGSAPSRPDLGRVPPSGSGAALVVDLPGAQGVAFGLALAERGYQPVPLYNVTTGPGQDVIDVAPLMAALREGAALLESTCLPDDAPPAFLIDSRRLDGTAAATMYDNRWMVFPQDFPSGRALATAHIARIVVVRGAESLRPDLRAVLRLWKRERIDSAALDPVTGQMTELTYDLSIWAVLADHMASLWNGLRENSAGGFGGTVPDPQGATGGYG